MNANLKGGNAVMRFLLAHGEKIGIGAILLCAAMLIWSAVNVPRLGKEPAELKSTADRAQTQITSFTWEDLAAQEDPAAETSITVKADPIEIDATQQVSAQAFPNIAPPNPYVIPPQPGRTDPLLLTAEELEVHADSGLWAEADPETIKQRQLEALKAAQKEQQEEARARDRRGDEDIDGRGRGRGRDRGREGRDGAPEERRRGANATIVMQPPTGVELQGFETIRAQSWVTVLAKVPIADQNKLYEDSLRSARGYNPTRDMPTYLGYMVQRAEVTAEGQGKWESLARVNRRELIKELATYPVNPPEVVASKYVHPLLTHPLPPLILKEWDDRVSHSTIPLATDEAALMEQVPAETEKPAEDGEPEDDTGFAVETPAPGAMLGGEFGGRGYGGEMMDRGGYGGEFSGRGMFGARGYGGGEMDGGGYGGRGGYGGEFSGRGGMYGGTLGAGSAVQLAEFSWDGKTEHVLLRFFDNTAQPGRRYRYRVQLAVMDVNHNVPVNQLDKSVTERRDALAKNLRSFRLTEWSKPSPTVSVPLPARLYVMSAKPPKGVPPQPEAEFLIKALDSRFAAEIALPESFTRGEVMNVRNRAKVVWSNRYEVEKDPEFNFYTGATLVDVRGGESLGNKNKDLVAPARSVVMDAGGKLTIRREISDQPTVKEFQSIVESPPDDRGGRGFGGEFGGGRGGRGRGGF